MSQPDSMDRRGFLKATAAGVGAVALTGALGRAEQAASTQPAANVIWRSKNPAMEYRRLGRTNYMVSRIVAGWGGDESLRRRMLAAGVNYFDTARGYGDYETDLKPFLARQRENVWVTSKATGVAGFNRIDPGVVKIYRKAMQDFLGDGEGDLLALHRKAIEKQKASGEKPDLRPAGERIAELYAAQLDESLERLGTDHVDCYFLHGVEIPWVFSCLEVWESYEKMHKAGKVKHFGFSTHKHQKEVLAAAVEANKSGPWKIDLTMPGVDPVSFDKLRPELEALKKQDVGIVAMKTSGIKSRPVDGREKTLSSMTDGKNYNEWERSKLWMLHLTEGTIDACIAAMKSVEEMDKDVHLPGIKLSSAAKRELRSLVQYEMTGACHLCGDCNIACPEHIAVSDMIRYHAYVHQYNEKQMARELYAAAGCDPSTLCNNCGKCHDACASGVPIMQLLQDLPFSMRA